MIGPAWLLLAFTDPLMVYSRAQWNINDLINEVGRMFKSDVFNPSSMSGQERRLHSTLSQAMDKLSEDNPSQAREALQSFRNEIAAMRSSDERWAPALEHTDAVLQKVRVLAETKNN